MGFIWGPIIAFFGKLALKYGLEWVEKKFPGSKAFIDAILKWIADQHAQGNTQAISQLSDHCNKLTGCEIPGPSDRVLGGNSDSSLLP